jgi:ribosome-associated protein
MDGRVRPVAASQPRVAGPLRPATVPAVREFELKGDMIRLGQLLKLAGIVGSGGEAKALIAEGQITVNGEPETRRGRQLHRGDMLDAGGEQLSIV